MKQAAVLMLLSGTIHFGATGADAQKYAFVDLSKKFTQNLDDKFGDDDRKGNFLKLTREQKLGGVLFKVEDGAIQLGSQALKSKPPKVEGIQIDRHCTRLFILHATGYGGGPNKPGMPWFVKDGTEIGEYRIRFEDRSVVKTPIIYGKDVRDWWFRPDEKGTSRGKVVWKGDNELATRYNCRLRLYLHTWKNPRPDKKIVAIDFVGRKEKTTAAPFCIAMTLELNGGRSEEKRDRP